MSATQKANPPGGGAGGPSTSQEPPGRPHRRSRLLTYAAFILLFFVVLVLAGALLIYGVVRPHGMIYKVEKAYIHEYNFTGCCHQRYLNAVYNITMTAENSNKKVRINYTDVRMYILCKKQQLAMADDIVLQDQEPLNVTTIDEKLYSTNVPLTDCKRKDLPDDSRGNMTIDVKLTAKIRFKPENWRLDGRTIRVSCSRVNAYFADGTNTFQPKTCNVEL